MNILLVNTLLVSLLSCGESDSKKETEAMSEFTGIMLFEEPHTDGNTFACHSCHALEEPALDGMRRAGHQIGDAFKRSSYKNGKVTKLIDAVNSCRTEWMNATEFTESDSAWKKLETFLQESAADKEALTLSFEIVPPATDLTGGDSIAGMKLFNSSCSICHGVNATGTVRAPSIAGTTLSRETIARRIRTSGLSESSVYDGLTGGRMPFFAKDRLSNEEIKNLLAYLEGTETLSDNPVIESGREDISLANPTENCALDHPKVGKTLTFSTKSHEVAGTATVIDNCTIHFDNFTFDGQGIDVRVYTGTAGNFNGGLSISVDLLGTPFNNASASLRLPVGVTLDNFDSLSIWCVPVGISFGDGIFN